MNNQRSRGKNVLTLLQKFIIFLFFWILNFDSTSPSLITNLPQWGPTSHLSWFIPYFTPIIAIKDRILGIRIEQSINLLIALWIFEINNLTNLSLAQWQSRATTVYVENFDFVPGITVVVLRKNWLQIIIHILK